MEGGACGGEKASSSGPQGSSEGSRKHRILGRGVHGDIRAPNILVRLPILADPLPLVLDVRSLKVAFLDFDWAGLVGEARYPPLMSQAVPWPRGAEHGAIISADHDIQLLASSFEGEVSSLKVFRWQVAEDSIAT